MIQVGNTLTTSEKDALVTLLTEFKKVFMWAWDWYRYSTSLHPNKSNHEAGQAEAEKDKAIVDSQDQGRSW